MNWQVSCPKFTVLVVADADGVVEFAAPIVRKFIGQLLVNLTSWAEKFGPVNLFPLEVNPMRAVLVITGGRDHRPFKALAEKFWLDRLCRNLLPVYKVDEFWHGNAKGVDSHGALWAEGRGLTVRSFPADWDRFGKSAGIKRNEQMYKAMNTSPDLCILVSFPGGVGTAHMTRLCEKDGIINVFRYLPGAEHTHIPGHEDIIPF